MASASSKADDSFFKLIGEALPLRWVIGAAAALALLWLGGQHFIVQPSKDRMYEEALKAVGRGDQWCANGFTSWDADRRVILCQVVAEKNQRIIDSAIRAGRR